MTECCSICDFQVLEVPDLLTKYGGIYHVVILKSKKTDHDCVFLPKRIPQNVRYSLDDLPTIQFLKADNVLKRRFYAICPPIQRKRLWNCSRRCANLGRKPITLIAGGFSNLVLYISSSQAITHMFHMIQRTNAIVSTGTNHVLLDNFVMDLRYEFHFGLDSKAMSELTRFVEFNQTSVQFTNDHDLSTFHPLIFTPKVTNLALWDKFRDLPPIWPLVFNLECLSIDSSDLPILYGEITHFPKLSSIYLSIDEHLDYSMIANFLQNQRLNLWFTFVCSFQLDFNEESLLKHFVPVEKQMLNQKGLCFTFDAINEFFMLR